MHIKESLKSPKNVVLKRLLEVLYSLVKRQQHAPGNKTFSGFLLLRGRKFEVREANSKCDFDSFLICILFVSGFSFFRVLKRACLKPTMKKVKTHR